MLHMLQTYLCFFIKFSSLFSLDPEQKEELLHVIEKLLSDKTTLVVGSAVMAFEEVCFPCRSQALKQARFIADLFVSRCAQSG